MPVPFSGGKKDNISGEYGHLFIFRRANAFPGGHNQHLIIGMNMELVSYALGKIDLIDDKLPALSPRQYRLTRYRSGK